MASYGAIDHLTGHDESQPPWSPFASAPYEIVVAVVDRLCSRDVAAAAASGALLAVAAREALAKRLTAALIRVGIKPQDGIDVMAHYVALHNAIARDDPVTVAAVLRVGVIPSPDAQMPPIESMAYWATSITATFGVTADNHVWGAPSTNRVRYVPCRVPGRNGVIPYELGDDLGAIHVLAVPLPRSALPQTPLVKAVRCGSRRVVRTLLAAGARPLPSVETLLACAIDRLAYGTVLLVEHRRGTAGRAPSTWATPEHRKVDGPGIIDDLLAAFARTPPPLGVLDINPLSVLRGALEWAGDAYGRDQVEEPVDGPLSRITRSLSSLIAAGYSPDERISLVPLDDAMYGHCLGAARRRSGAAACATDGGATTDIGRLGDNDDDGAGDMRRRAVEVTERQAVTATCKDDYMAFNPPHISRHPSVMIARLGLDAIVAAYAAIPRPDATDGS
ncbi:hypothetical protein psal_cds_700 [Pandoravirus salinus]|uniref:Uncharacterized protein n=1 Tax=Pandoravirus salinus TaxID=1349410 RepID=S4VVJ3_9VIRU|nr:hypothetical protein psal_cds_700 [Pandoravirus salinus]AGO84654.1 hypothetical protein psal_cds_700 [Pandoravirus salinus]